MGSLGEAPWGHPDVIVPLFGSVGVVSYVEFAWERDGFDILMKRHWFIGWRWSQLFLCKEGHDRVVFIGCMLWIDARDGGRWMLGGGWHESDVMWCSHICLYLINFALTPKHCKIQILSYLKVWILHMAKCVIVSCISSIFTSSWISSLISPIQIKAAG